MQRTSCRYRVVISIVQLGDMCRSQKVWRGIGIVAEASGTGAMGTSGAMHMEGTVEDTLWTWLNKTEL